MDEGRSSLAQIVTGELARPAPPEALGLAAEMRRRHGATVAAVLFYGSCLRTQQIEGRVLDFYVLVDSYRAAYDSRSLAWLNAVLPPNVFYVEIQAGQRTLRAKYAVISTADFEQAASLWSIHAIIWGRFCQPVLLVFARDDTAHATVVRALVESILTLAIRAVTLLPASGETRRFQPRDLWQRGFRETYATELRAERPATIQGLYQAAPERYDRVACQAFRELAQRGACRVQTEGEVLCVTLPARQYRRVWFDWRIRRPVAKILYAIRLLKSAATFTDWLPYVVGKIGRHAGVSIVLNERQRRHPFLLGGPLLLKLLLQRRLR